MSLIHEALQKAEQERRAGELPSLSFHPIDVRVNRREPRRWPIWVALAVVGLAAVGYRNRELIVTDRGQDLAARMIPKREGDAAKESDRSQERPIGIARKPDSVARQTHAKPVASNTIDAIAAAKVDALAAHLGAGRGIAPEIVDARPLGSVAASSPSVPPAPLPDSTTTPVVREVPAPVVPDAAQTMERPTKPMVPINPPEVGTVPATSASATNPAPLQDTSARLPWLYELPLATRQELPPLKVSLQVFHQDSRFRFAIIDGRRVNEGDVIGSGLTMIEIQREAILFDFRGTRFLLPRLGR